MRLGWSDLALGADAAGREALLELTWQGKAPVCPAMLLQEWRPTTRMAADASGWCAKLATMGIRVRDYEAVDADIVVGLSLRAWAPVFASMQELLGPELFGRLRGDWRISQETAVRALLADSAERVWVADDQGQPVGFVAATLHPDSLMGEISMLAVDPDAQNHGVGMALTATATDWLRASEMQVAMIDTGGDPAHDPARRVYEKADYTAVPIVRYFKAL